MKSNKVKKVIHKIGLLNSLMDKDVEDIVNSQFYFVAEVIKTADRDTMDFRNVRLVNLGMFGLTPQKLKFLAKLNDERKEKEMSKMPQHISEGDEAV